MKHRPREFFDTLSIVSEEGKKQQLLGALKGSRHSAKKRFAARAARTPTNLVLELEAEYNLRKHHTQLWNSSRKTKKLLELSRNETLSATAIAEELNKWFLTQRFTRIMVISRLRFLRGLAKGEKDPWRFSGGRGFRTPNP